jgi:Lon protease-like protein
MSDDLSLPHSFNGTARLFPLPNVVLFPQVMLPLHVFEPRYRQMTADALDDDRLMAVVLLKPGWEAEYEQRPALHPVACLGKIVADKRLEDGRYNLWLRGLSRARIVEELDREKPYRSARVELLESSEIAGLEHRQAYRKELTRLVTQWLSTMGLMPEQLTKLFKSELPLEALADLLSFALPLDTPFKQELLEELDADQRVGRLLHYLETNTPPKVTVSSSHKFPPDFSTN